MPAVLAFRILRQSSSQAYTFTLAASQTLTPTAMEANPVLIRLLPPRVTIGSVSARLTTATDPAQPVVGAPVVFTSGNTALCTGITGSNGTASCSLTVSKAAVVMANGGFTATFNGTAGYSSSNDEGQLIG